MKKNLIFLLFLMASIFSYSDVKWDGEDGKIAIVYKIVDPIIVEVDQPKKLYVASNQKHFTYSEVNKNREKINVRVNAPYNPNQSIDDILRAIYERVYFELQDGGKFQLTNTADPQKIIDGQGYFVDNEANISNKETSYSKEFVSRVNGNKFYTTSQIDADFTMREDNMPMGVYKGTLKLDVWFGGSF